MVLVETRDLKNSAFVLTKAGMPKYAHMPEEWD